jgi:hypothetical protein
MKVRELIEKLQQLPPEVPVMLDLADGVWTVFEVECEQLIYDGGVVMDRVVIAPPAYDEPDSADPIVRNGR